MDPDRRDAGLSSLTTSDNSAFSMIRVLFYFLEKNKVQKLLLCWGRRPSFFKIKVNFFWFGRRPHSGNIFNAIITFALREVVASRTSKHGRVRPALRLLFFRKAGKREEKKEDGGVGVRGRERTRQCGAPGVRLLGTEDRRPHSSCLQESNNQPTSVGLPVGARPSRKRSCGIYQIKAKLYDSRLT